MARTFAWMALALTLASCSSNNPLKKFEELDREAAEFGLLTAGALRVSRFESKAIEDLRKKQIELVEQLRAEFAKAGPKPEFLSSHLRITDTLLQLSAKLSEKAVLPESNIKDVTNAIDSLKTVLAEMFKSNAADALEANRIELARIRLGHLKYLVSEEESLRLLETSPPEPSFNRYIISVELTALLRREKARAAMVYLDLYPLTAELFAHDAGTWLDAQKKSKAPAEYQKSIQIEWPKLIEPLRRSFWFPECRDCESKSPLLIPPQIRQDDSDSIAAMHVWLNSRGLMPRIVHVEPLDEGELIGTQEIRAHQFGANLGLGFLFGQGGVSTRTMDALRELGLGVDLRSFAFAAGTNRAGWCFVPPENRTIHGHLKPTERRIRMVVDVPKFLQRLAVHTHKVYLDECFQPIYDAAFWKQMERQNKAKVILSSMENYFPDSDKTRDLLGNANSPAPEKADAIGSLDFPDTTNWSIAKSRMRNNVHHTWSSLLVAQVCAGGHPTVPPGQLVVFRDDGKKSASFQLHARYMETGFLSARVRIIHADPIAPLFGWLGLAPPAKKTSELYADSVQFDLAGSAVTVAFPSFKALGIGVSPFSCANDKPAFVEELIVEFRADPKDSTPTHDWRFRHYGSFDPPADVKKAAASIKGILRMASNVRRIVADGNGVGTLKLVFSLDEDKNKDFSPTRAFVFSISGADLKSATPGDILTAKGSEWVVTKAGTVELTLSNCIPGKDITLKTREEIAFKVDGVEQSDKKESAIVIPVEAAQKKN